MECRTIIVKSLKELKEKLLKIHDENPEFDIEILRDNIKFTSKKTLEEKSGYINKAFEYIKNLSNASKMTLIKDRNEKIEYISPINSEENFMIEFKKEIEKLMNNRENIGSIRAESTKMLKLLKMNFGSNESVQKLRITDILDKRILDKCNEYQNKKMDEKRENKKGLDIKIILECIYHMRKISQFEIENNQKSPFYCYYYALLSTGLRFSEIEICQINQINDNKFSVKGLLKKGEEDDCIDEIEYEKRFLLNADHTIKCIEYLRKNKISNSMMNIHIKKDISFCEKIHELRGIYCIMIHKIYQKGNINEDIKQSLIHSSLNSSQNYAQYVLDLKYLSIEQIERITIHNEMLTEKEFKMTRLKNELVEKMKNADYEILKQIEKLLN